MMLKIMMIKEIGATACKDSNNFLSINFLPKTATPFSICLSTSITDFAGLVNHINLNKASYL